VYYVYCVYCVYYVYYDHYLDAQVEPLRTPARNHRPFRERDYRLPYLPYLPGNNTFAVVGNRVRVSQVVRGF
jgi:hypothetical protein